MGFSGGGSNVLKAHTHDGNIAQDGGALDMDGVTQGSLTAGDLIYSDGNNLQRLAIGGSGQSLTSSGSAPQWSAAGGAAIEILDQQTSTTASPLNSFDFTLSPSITFPSTSEIYIWIRGATTTSADIQVRFGSSADGGIVSSVYEMTQSRSYQATQNNADYTSRGEIIIGGHPQLESAQGFQASIKVTCIEAHDGVDRLLYQSVCNGKETLQTIGGRMETTQADLTYIKINASGSYNFTNGTTCVVYKLNYS